MVFNTVPISAVYGYILLHPVQVCHVEKCANMVTNSHLRRMTFKAITFVNVV